MGILSFFNKFNSLPWKHGEAIYSFIKRNTLQASGRLKDCTGELPDDEKRFKPGELHWVAGGKDGALGHHAGSGNDQENIQKVADLLVSISKKGSTRSKIELYRVLENDSLIEFIDPVLEKAISIGISPEPYLHDFARLLAIESPDRGPVKFGIALLGLIRDPKDLEVITTLGKHEELTLFSAVAITNLFEEPEQELFKLAQAVEGWGKINVVERLAKTTDPQIKSWLVRQGYNNSIMYEYLAYTCAMAGDLHKALDDAKIDRELFDGAGDIINTLIAGGPAQDINDYPFAATVISRYLYHFPKFPRALKHFLVLQSIKQYLSDTSWTDADRKQNGWNNDVKNNVLKLVQDYLGYREWLSMAQEGLTSDVPTIFHEANRTAEVLGMDTWDIHWKRLNESHLDSGRWYEVMIRADKERIEQIISLAANVLPLKTISTGPAQEMGLGPEYQIHSCLDFVLQELKSFPGKGKDLILAGLRSPVVRNRNMALNALSMWTAEILDYEIKKSLGQALVDEPNADVRNKIQMMIDGKNAD